MKRQTAVLFIVVAFFCGFVVGAVVGILKSVPDSKSASKTSVSLGTGEPGQASTDISAKEITDRIHALREILKKDPGNLSAWVELGNLYFDTDQPREAIEAYTRYLAIKPENPDVRTDMGIMFRRLGDPDRAIEEFRIAARSDPTHANSRYNIGVVLLHDKQDIKGAIEAWEDYIRVDSKSERASRVRAQMQRLKSMLK